MTSTPQLKRHVEDCPRCAGSIQIPRSKLRATLVVIVLSVSSYGAFRVGKLTAHAEDQTAHEQDDAKLSEIYDGLEKLTDRLITLVEKHHLHEDDDGEPEAQATPVTHKT